MRNQVTIFLPTYSLLTPKSARTSERVNLLSTSGEKKLYSNITRRLPKNFKVAWLGVWQINHTFYHTHFNVFLIKFTKIIIE